MERLKTQEQAARLAESLCIDIDIYNLEVGPEALGPFVEEARAVFHERVSERWHHVFEEASRRLLEKRAAQMQRPIPDFVVLINGVPASEWEAETERRRAWPNDRLLDALASDEGREREYALELIARCVPQSGAFAFHRPWTERELLRAMDELLKLIVERARPARMRAGAIYAATRLGFSQPNILDAVRDGFEDEDASVRMEAIRSFPDDPELVSTHFGDLVIRACEDSSDDVVWTAVHRLGELGSLARGVLSMLLDMLDHSNDSVGGAAAYAINSLVKASVISKEDITKVVEARPVSERSVVLVCDLLDSASDPFVQRAGSLGYRPALNKIAARGADELGKTLRAFRERDRAEFAAFLVRASEEEWDYLALGRGAKRVWAAALRPLVDDAEPDERDAIAELLRRWAE